VIAEEDLKLRGPGDLEGTQQSGVVNMHIADLVNDIKILEVARATAQQLIETDPSLSQAAHQPLLRHMAEISKDKIWSKIS
ncbi:MAG TPA: hypothetical protein VK174_13705, partial [Chitinophagales bacterium]|nr:hypothetical protein [Chitinophagales bacterium]